MECRLEYAKFNSTRRTYVSYFLKNSYCRNMLFYNEKYLRNTSHGIQKYKSDRFLQKPDMCLCIACSLSIKYYH